MAAFSEEIVEIKCDPHKILNNTYLHRFFCSKFKSFHTIYPLRETFWTRRLQSVLLAIQHGIDTYIPCTYYAETIDI